MPKFIDKKWINGKWRYFYDTAKKGIRDFHATKPGMALKYNPVSNAIAKASSAAKAKKGMKIYNQQTMHDSQRIAIANAKSAKKAHSSPAAMRASVLRQTRQAKKGAAKILLDLKRGANIASKRFRKSVKSAGLAVANNPLSKAYRRNKEAKRLARNRARRAKRAADAYHREDRFRRVGVEGVSTKAKSALKKMSANSYNGYKAKQSSLENTKALKKLSDKKWLEQKKFDEAKARASIADYRDKKLSKQMSRASKYSKRRS